MKQIRISDFVTFSGQQFRTSLFELRYWLIYPCRCLWREFSQMTRTIPLRRMTLHFVQIFFTEERTFIGLSCSLPDRVHDWQ